MRGVALGVALVAALTLALVTVHDEPRTQITYRAAAPGDLRDAIEARLPGIARRVEGAGDTWSVVVRSSDATPAWRNLDWDGTLALYEPCADVPPHLGTSAEIRDLVEGEVEGPRTRLFRATSSATAQADCVERTPLLALVATGAEGVPQPPAIDVSLGPTDVARLEALGAGRRVLIGFRHTVLADVTLPLATTQSTMRMPLLGGELAPLYVDFFSRALRVPSMPRLVETSRAPLSPWSDALPFVAIAIVVALVAGVLAARIDRSEGTPRNLDGSAAAALALAPGLLIGALGGWLFADASIVRAGLLQGLSLAAAAVLLGRDPKRSIAMIVAVAVAIGVALDQSMAAVLTLTPDASLTTGLVSLASRAVLGLAQGYALSMPKHRVALAIGAWAATAGVEALLLTSA